MASKRKIVLYSVLGLLIVILLAMLLLPGIAKNHIVKNSKELIGRQVDMEGLKINFFSGKLSVYNFKMFEANEKDIFTSFDTLIINTIPYKYFSNVKALDQFYLEGLKVNVSKKGSSYNFDDLVAFHSVNDTVNIEDEEDFKYILNNLELKDAIFNFHDSDVDHTTTMDKLSLFIPQIYWDQEHQSDAKVKFNIGQNATIESDFKMQPKTGDFEGEIEVNGLQLSSFYKYATPYANINALNGTVSSVIKLQGNMEEPENIHISATATTEKFEMKDTNNQLFLSSELISCNIPEVNPMKSSIVIESIVVDEPYVKFELDSVSNNYFRIFNYPFEDVVEITDSTAVEASSSYSYAINSLKVKKGVMDYTDNLTGEPFNYHLSDIVVDTDSITSQSEWIDINSNMLLNNRGTLQAEIGINPQDPLNAQIDIGVENFLLADLNIYSNYYTGHSILVGDMFYFSDSKLTNGQINSENHLLIKNVDVKNNKGGLFAIPLKVAVWVLKDKNGDIELDIPVAGDVNDPQVDTWALVWTTIRKKIFNASKNPVKPLARFIGAKPEDIEIIAFKYPDTIITTEQARQLDLILDLENKKGGLDVEMNFLADPQKLDSLIMKEGIHKLDSMLVPYPDPDLNTAILNVMPTDTTGTSIKSTSLKPTSKYNSTPQLDSLRAQYQEAVVNNVRNYLIEKNSATRIIVQKAKVSNPDNIDSPPQIKVKYSMREENELNNPEEEEKL